MNDKRQAGTAATGGGAQEPMKPLQIVQAGQRADVYIYGDLTASQWFEDETSPYSFRKELRELEAEGVRDLDIHIDSCGGDISAGWAIYNTLQDWPGSIATYADGYVASAAIYPFLAGERRVANAMSAFFLHQAWGSRSGNADELRKAADELELLNELGLEAFAAVGIDKAQALKLEKATTWIRPSEALELGLATELRSTGKSETTQQSARGQILQKLFADADAETVNERRARLGLAPIQEAQAVLAPLHRGQAKEPAEGRQEAQDGAQGAAGESDKAQSGGPEAGSEGTLAGFFERLAGGR